MKRISFAGTVVAGIAVVGMALQASTGPSKANDSAASDAGDKKTIRERLDALEKENADLKKRLNRVEKTPARQVAVPTAVPAAATDAGVSSALKGAMGAAVVPDYNSWQGRVPGKVPAQFLRARYGQPAGAR